MEQKEIIQEIRNLPDFSIPKHLFIEVSPDPYFRSIWAVQTTDPKYGKEQPSHYLYHQDLQELEQVEFSQFPPKTDNQLNFQ